MKLKEYIKFLDDMNEKFKPKDNGETFKEAMLGQVSIWSNSACKGYTIHAMKNAGLDISQIKSVLAEMSDAFNDKTVEEAEELYENFIN